jgi:adenine-specific DNA-methyltransferase
VAYYFYYEKGKETTLNYDKLSIIKQKAERYIVYADTCTIDKDYMNEKSIIFKKIPRDIQKF